MMGLEQDLHSALQERGLELGSFQMEERTEDDKRAGDINTFQSKDEKVETDNFDQDVIGGIFVNRRV